MTFFNLDTVRMSTSLRPRNSQRCMRFSPILDVMEGRTLLSTLTVTNNLDQGPGSLRQAINVANFDNGNDTIKFSPSLAGGQVITLDSRILIVASMTIDGANEVTISGGDRTRLFVVQSTAGAVNLDNLTLTDGRYRGGAGADAQGGAIINSGTLTLENDTLSNSVAQGGAGSNGATGGDGTQGLGGRNGQKGGDGGRGGDGLGGAIYNSGILTVRQSTFIGNEALGGDGGNGGNGGNGASNSAAGSLGGAGGAGGVGGVGEGGSIFNAGTLRLNSNTFMNDVIQGGDGGNGGNGGSGFGASKTLPAPGGAAGDGGVVGGDGSTGGVAKAHLPGVDIDNSGVIANNTNDTFNAGILVNGKKGIPGWNGTLS